MDLENIFYVILAAIYFLSRVFKKRRQPDTAESSGESEPETGRKPVTFEDLLKEFGVDQEKEKPKKALEEKGEVAESERMEQEYRSRHADEEAQSVFNRSIKEAQALAAAEEEKEPVFKEFKSYQQRKETNGIAAEIKALLKSDQGGKKAIILSEILNRKY